MWNEAQKEFYSIKCYVSDDNHITLNCPNCNTVTPLDVSNFKEKREIKVRCKCKKILKCLLEYRKHHRKKVKLPGEYMNIRDKKNDLMFVNNISPGGIEFASISKHTIRAGDELILTFKLDDKKNTEIKLNCTVKSVRDNDIGVQFQDASQYKKDLRFYFMS